MKFAYPVVIKKDGNEFIVYIPDMNIHTQGKDIPDAIMMARDAIGLMGIDLMEDGKEIPTPGTMASESNDTEICTLVDVDFEQYKKQMENRTVSKNCSLPFWLCKRGEEMGLNFSQVLRKSLEEIVSKEQELVS